MIASEEVIFISILDILLPRGGLAIVLAEVFIDESGTDLGSPVMCLAGHVYTSENAKKLSAAWKEVLDEYGLPFFRMSACAHGTWPFDALSKQQCIDVEIKMIALIRQYSDYGFATSVKEQEYLSVMPSELREAIGSPYSFCIRQCLTLVNNWIKLSKFEGKVAYFFEAGHDSQGEADRFLKDDFKHSRMTEHFHYVAHTFADKKEVRPLQAADLLAWQWFTDRKRPEGKAQRKDLAALIRPQDTVIDYSAKMISDLSAFLYERAAERARDSGLPD